ncbi:MAG: membrane protein [Peptococcaceae bacterium BRH_c4a]|nr:MAG: membrane protein [Peptococcaceae bacterium BRH_c4a]
MDTSTLVLLALLIMAIAGRSNLVAMASCILMAIKFSGMEEFVLPLLEKKGLKFGLLILMVYILMPVAKGEVSLKEVKYSFSTIPGLIALVGGALATHLNNEGLKLMKAMPEIIFGMTVGTILGTVFFRGIPCGPVMAAAVTAILLEIYAIF